MKALYEIVEAARTNQPLDNDESRYAIIAFDVLLAQLDLPNSSSLVQFEEYFKAARLPPKDYIGWDNDPDNPEFAAWYKAMSTLTAPPLTDGETED